MTTSIGPNFNPVPAGQDDFFKNLSDKRVQLATTVADAGAPRETNGATEPSVDQTELRNTPGGQIVSKQVANSNANGGGACGFLGQIISIFTTVLAPVFSFITPFADFLTKTFSPIVGAIDTVKGLFGGGKQEAADPNAAADAKNAQQKAKDQAQTAAGAAQMDAIYRQNGLTPDGSTNRVIPSNTLGEVNRPAPGTGNGDQSNLPPGTTPPRTVVNPIANT